MDIEQRPSMVQEDTGPATFLPPVATATATHVWWSVTGTAETAMSIQQTSAGPRIESSVQILPDDQTGRSSDSVSVRATERDWLLRHAAEAVELSGQWAAIDGDELVSHGYDLGEVLRRAEEAGHPHPLITPVNDPRVSSIY